MNRVTAGSLAFLLFAVGVSAWLLLRQPSTGALDAAGAGPTDGRAGMTFAEWSARSDAVLLADIDPGAGGSTVPRRFLVVVTRADAGGALGAADGKTFSWAPADRAASAQSLAELGFRVSLEGLAYPQPEDPLWSDPIARVDGGTEQAVTLRSKVTSTTARFTRRRADPRAAPYWNRRAIGFVSNDSQKAYVTPDAIVIPMGAPPAAP